MEACGRRSRSRICASDSHLGWSQIPPQPNTFDKLAESSSLEAAPPCSPASQIGTATFFGQTPLSIAGIPLYNMRPSPGSVARFGLNFFGLVTIFDGTLPPDPASGIQVGIDGINEALPLDGVGVTLWGTPAGASHDADRSCPGETAAPFEGPSCPAGIPPRAFLRLQHATEHFQQG